MSEKEKRSRFGFVLLKGFIREDWPADAAAAQKAGMVRHDGNPASILLAVTIGAAAIRAAGITPKTVFIGAGHIGKPLVESDIIHRAAIGGLNAAVLVAAADAFDGPVRAVIEILGMLFISLPKSAIRGLHGG